MKTVDTVVEDITNVLKNVIDGNVHTVSEEALSHLGKNIAEKVRNALEPRVRVRPDKTLYASEVGKPCTRQLWYSYHRPELSEPITPSLKMKFLYGDLLEELLLFFAEAAGHEVANHQRLTEVKLDNGWTVRGRIDATIDGVVVDTKSASGYGFKKFQEGLTDENDSFGYRAQLSVYTTDSSAGFLVINKENGHITYTKGGAEEYDIEGRLESICEALEGETPPERTFSDIEDGKSGNRKLCTECSYCSYKNECWDNLRVFAYSGKPVFLTTVEKLPKVEEITGRVPKNIEES